MANEPASGPTALPPSGRLMSIDVLRGFDMFWIIGADTLVHAIHRMGGDPVTGLVADQMRHSAWEGFHFYDLIFPLFIFIAGVSTAFSLLKTIEKEGRPAALRRIAVRSLLLVVFGIICYGGVCDDWGRVRLLGVLQRIGLVYLATGVLVCLLRPRGLVAACISLLLGYWGLMALVPIRDIHLDQDSFARLAATTGVSDEQRIFADTTATVRGHYEPGYNLADHLDFQYLPGRKWNRFYDPEGLLSTLPAIATCLLGYFTGLLLRHRAWSERRRLAVLLGAGAAAVLLGELWGLQFPVVKRIWTSSFVLVAGGWSALLLGGFYWLIDIKGWRGWCAPFMWIGMNAITAYMAYDLIHFRTLADHVVGGPVARALDAHIASGLGGVVGAATALMLIWALLWYLYRRQVFLRL